MRPLRLTAWVIVLGTSVAAMLVYPTLPSDIPTSINVSGAVTRRAPTSLWSWFLLPLIMVALQLVFIALRDRLPRHPESFNFPDKEEFLRLPDEFRGPVVVQMQWLIDAMSVLVQMVLLMVFALVWYAATGRASGGLMLVPLLMSVMTTPFVFLLLSRVTNAVEAQTKEWRAAGSPPRATR
ncbi:MAG: DUF1648 domain-containing protein [Gemmatimonadaceae bacterium]|nr:DUF1648 domain-containing protein [Gemmatimonadaceae bacterium]